MNDTNPENKTANMRSAFLYIVSKLRVVEASSSTNVLDLVRRVVDLTRTEATRLFQLTREERNSVIVQVLRDVAKGPDGILGTPDDLMDTTTLAELTQLVQTSFLQHLVAMLEDARTPGVWTQIARRVPFCCWSMI